MKLFTAFILVLAGLPAALSGSDWPQWRGPMGRGVSDERGIVSAGARHEVIRTNSLGEPVYASPAIADGRIFIRGEWHLFAIGRTDP